MSEETLFELALNTPDAERAALLDRECAGNPALRERVEALLAAHFAPGSPLNPPADGTRTFSSGERTASHRSATETEGTLVAGRYKLLQQVGEGGMGSVWMADQTEPVKRRVAVKLIRVERGSSKTILARFEAERQAIALMDHPNIAKLLDAGTTDTGSPFFVMELVKGVPLNEFCDSHKLSIPDRLHLFMQICSAVQHAHQKGVIHRDLKPSNILVESHDGKPVPKVIDFGLAKATTGLQLTEHTLFTGFGSVMGTPLYMAPEQATFNAVDVDTRADVYALGVILYELLTGTTPLTRDTVKKAALDEMLKLIREQDAPTPSSRISEPSVAANRQTEPAKLGRFVKGELDWIVLKALSKDRDRRYETATGFAKDIERFLAHEPVQAGPPGARYRLKKFVRRNRGRVVAASLVLFALLAGIAGTTWALVRALDAERLARAETARANDERDRAVRAEDDAVRKSREVVEERNRATDKADLAEAVSDFLRDDILGATTYSATFSRHTGSEITVAEAVDAAAAEVGKKFANRPLVEATIRATLGNSYLELGKIDKAAAQLEEAVRLFRRAKGDDDDAVSVLATLRLGWARLRQGRLDESEQIHVDAVRRAERVLPEDHTNRILAYGHYATILMNQKKHEAAEPLFRRAIAVELAARGETRNLQVFRGNLALLYQEQRRFDEAEALHRQAVIEHRRLRGDTHPNSLLMCRNLSRVLLAQKKWAEAESFAREALAGALKHLGERRPPTALLLEPYDLLSEVAFNTQKPEDHRAAAAGLLAVVEPQPEALDKGARGAAARTWQRTRRLGHFDQTIRLAQVLHRATRLDYEANAPDAVGFALNLSISYSDAGMGPEAVALVDDWLPRAQRSTDPRLADTGTRNAVRIYDRYGEHAKAEPLRRQLVEVAKKTHGPGSSQHVSSLGLLGDNLLQQEKWADAEACCREVVAILEAKEPPPPVVYVARSQLGSSLLGQKKYEEAEPLLAGGYEGMKQRAKAGVSVYADRLPVLTEQLATLYAATGRPDEAAKWRAERAKYPFVAPPPRAKK